MSSEMQEREYQESLMRFRGLKYNIGSYGRYPEEYFDDAETIAEMHIEHLEAESALAAERALPIDAEWLKSLGARWNKHRMLYELESGVNQRGCCLLWPSGNTTWRVDFGFVEATYVLMRGDLLDFLKAFKFEVKHVSG